MMALILGGARSGKSNFAENLAKDLSEANCVIYVATATADDKEMAARIAFHQKSRPQDWQLIEETLYLSSILNNAKPGQTILIDCLTLWLTNWLCSEKNKDWQTEKDQFLTALQSTKANVILVSNEVGSGIVPMGELSREFVDQAGWLNQAIAKVVDKVSLIVAGCELPLIKPIKPIKSSHR